MWFQPVLPQTSMVSGEFHPRPEGWCRRELDDEITLRGCIVRREGSYHHPRINEIAMRWWWYA